MGAHLAILTLAPDRDYVAGQQVVASMAFTVGGVAADPSDVTLIAQRPGGSAVTYTYSGATITRDGTGAYHVNVTLDAGGVWMFHVKGTGAVVAATVDDLNCQDPFPVPAPPANPGLPYAGQVAVVAASGTYAPVSGTVEGDTLKYAPDGASPTGFSWQKRRGWVIPDIDTAGGADATAEIQRCLNLRAGVCVELPEGTIKTTGTLTLGLNGVTLTGRGDASTFLSYQGTGASCKAIRAFGSQAPRICDLQVIANGANAYSADALIEVDSCYLGRVEQVLLAYGFRGVHVYRSTETWLRDITMSSLVGDAGVLFEGTIAAPSFRCDWIGGTCGLGLPAGLNLLRGARVISTAYAVGDMVTNGGYVWMCTFAGTSGTGGGPVTVPGGGSLAFSTQVTDGTCKWQFVCHANHAWLYCSSYSSTMRAIGVATVGGGKAVYITDPANTGTSFPNGVHLDGFESDRVYVCNALIDAGFEIRLVECPFGDAMTASGVIISSTVKGEVKMVGGRVFAARQHGVVVNGNGVKIEDVVITGCGLSAANTFDGINVGNGVSKFSLLDNVIGDMGLGGSVIRYGIAVGTGCDHYQIGPNRLDGNVTGGLLDSSAATATDRRVGLNTADEFELKTVSQLGATGALAGGAIHTGTPPPGLYRISAYLCVTTVGAGGTSAVNLNLAWTDPQGVKGFGGATMALNAAGKDSEQVLIQIGSGGVNWSTSLSGAGTTGFQYSLKMVCQRIG